MQITQIRIAGFKSFVDPTDVPVLPGLTGIVGPNGCGKSNLLESLRWAMGANSARAMRGGEMDDLIFSGSADRPARETAEVTLVLDNSKRTAPAEFNSSDTLEVLRRLKRGSGSTYKLNGRTVRGKDIQLIFADASTGANSPSLVRQGQISELIASKPQNRRRILEEAAGISGLNTRRHDAELKLRGAETNLERLSDLSAEVERQLNSLKRQASKARKYKALSRKIAALEAWSAHLKWLEAKTLCQTARDNLSTAKASVEALTRADAVAETKRLEANEGLTPLREAESLAAAKLGQVKISLARLEAEAKAARDAFDRLQSEHNRIKADLERESGAEADAAEALERTGEELNALPKQDVEANKALEQDLRTALESARARLNEAQIRADDVAQKLAEARAARQAARANAEAQRRQEQALVTKVERIQAEIAAIGDIDALKAKADAAAKASEKAELELHDAERAVDEATEALLKARQTEDSLRAPVSEAEKAVGAIQGEIGGLQRLLAKGHSTNATPVLDQIRTEDGYEKAIAAALGDDLRASIDRSAPAHWSGSRDADLKLQKGVRPLSDVTEAPAELAGRLTQCGIVAASDGAVLAEKLLPGQRLVSKEGHLWRWDGFVRTPDAPLSAAERLEQQARLEAAEKELVPAETALNEAKAALETAKLDREAAQEALKRAQAQIQPTKTSLARLKQDAINNQQAVDRTALKQESLLTGLSAAESDLKLARETLAVIDPVGESGDDTALEAELAVTREALQTAREQETEARGRLTDLTRDQEKILQRRSALERDFETWTKRKQAAETRKEDLIQREAETRKSLAEARTSPETADERLETLRCEVERFEVTRKEAADALAVGETALRTAETEARQTNQAAASAREALAAAKVRLDGAETSLTGLETLARTQFQRTPDGLLGLAQIGLSEEAMAELDQATADQRIDQLKRDRDQLGGVNMDAEREVEELSDRLGTQANEKKDLIKAIAKLREGVDALNAEGRERLLRSFETVNTHFKTLFTTLFRGGQAELRLVDADDPLAAGLEIFAQPPGKKLGTLSLMSGGEQALTATALIFAVFLSNPAPICVLDEVDAPLDDANVDRYCRILDEMRNRTNTRFIVITHNAVTMSRMDRLYGVTMREKGVSKLVSVDLETAEELVAAE
ncbi:MAG: chromosome segregation protein SMC [Pseudomonadota bacterium]